MDDAWWSIRVWRCVDLGVLQKKKRRGKRPERLYVVNHYWYSTERRLLSISRRQRVSDVNFTRTKRKTVNEVRNNVPVAISPWKHRENPHVRSRMIVQRNPFFEIRNSFPTADAVPSHFFRTFFNPLRKSDGTESSRLPDGVDSHDADRAKKKVSLNNRFQNNI